MCDPTHSPVCLSFSLPFTFQSSTGTSRLAVVSYVCRGVETWLRTKNRVRNIKGKYKNILGEQCCHLHTDKQKTLDSFSPHQCWTPNDKVLIFLRSYLVSTHTTGDEILYSNYRHLQFTRYLFIEMYIVDICKLIRPTPIVPLTSIQTQLQMLIPSRHTLT